MSACQWYPGEDTRRGLACSDSLGQILKEGFGERIARGAQFPASRRKQKRVARDAEPLTRETKCAPNSVLRKRAGLALGCVVLSNRKVILLSFV